MPENNEDAITRWATEIQNGNEAVSQQLFDACYPRLLRFARSKLPPNLRRVLDEEDIAVSAFKSFYDAAQRGSTSDIQNRDELWRFLTCITARKIVASVRRETRIKRGHGQVRGNSVFASADEKSGVIQGFEAIAGNDHSPATWAEMSEQCEKMIDALEDPNLQVIALLRLEGYSVDEIAVRIDCAKRTVERRLSLIRKTWEQFTNRIEG